MDSGDGTKKRFVSYGVVALSTLGVLLLLLMAGAQNKPPAAGQKKAAAAEVKPEDKPTPHLADGHPDFSGFYNNTDRYPRRFRRRRRRRPRD